MEVQEKGRKNPIKKILWVIACSEMTSNIWQIFVFCKSFFFSFFFLSVSVATTSTPPFLQYVSVNPSKEGKRSARKTSKIDLYIVTLIFHERIRGHPMAASFQHILSTTHNLWAMELICREGRPLERKENKTKTWPKRLCLASGPHMPCRPSRAPGFRNN